MMKEKQNSIHNSSDIRMSLWGRNIKVGILNQSTLLYVLWLKSLQKTVNHNTKSQI